MPISPASYLIYLDTDNHSVEFHVNLLNTAGDGHALYGLGNESIWIIPFARRTADEVKETISSLPEVRDISVLPISDPVKGEALADARKLFEKIGLFSANVTDEDFSTYLHGWIDGRPQHYIDIEESNGGWKRERELRIKLIIDHPDFSPSWISNKPNEPMEGDLTVDDITVVHDSVTVSIPDPLDEEEGRLP